MLADAAKGANVLKKYLFAVRNLGKSKSYPAKESRMAVEAKVKSSSLNCFETIQRRSTSPTRCSNPINISSRIARVDFSL